MKRTNHIAANNKNSGGNTMSLKKRATRRLSLLAGSSLAAAALATIGFTAMVSAPTMALAANECAPVGVDPASNGTVADTRTCTGATTYQTSGITYTTEGNLTVTATGAMDVGAVGVNLIGEGADNVTFSINNALTGTAGAVIDVTTQSGDINVSTFGIAAATAGTTNAVRMVSTGGGDITFTKNQPSGNFPAANTAINNTAAGAEAALAAITNGGNIVLTVNTGPPTSTPTNFDRGMAGRLRGILAQTSETGSVTLNVAGVSGVTASPVDGVAAVDIQAGTGGVDINLSGTVGGRPNRAGIATPFIDVLAMRVVSAGAVTVDNTAGMVVGAVDFSGVTAGGVRFENVGTGPTLSAQGSVFPNGGTWHASGASIFTSQNDLLIMGGINNHSAAPGVTIDFGGGTDTFNMSGVWRTNGVVLSNLETFNNSGTIWLGSSQGPGLTPVIPNERAEDVLSMPGAAFNATGASRLRMDVVLSGTSQVGCATLTGAADCLDLRDGTTTGTTILTINDASPDAMLSGYIPDGITLVDVSGSGSTAAGHFTLDPASTSGYVHPVYGPAFDRPGAFVYLYRYDAENQRHVLISQPKNRDIFDYAILSGAAQSIWRLTADTVTDRQTDLRDGAEGGSIWLRTAGEVTRRDVETSFTGWDGVQTFDNSYNLYAGTIIGGMDLLSGSTGGFDYALGAQIGYVSSSFDMDESESSGRFTGATGGAYGSLWSEGVFLDGALNLNGLTLDYQHPALGSKTTTFINSVGGKAEGGARAPISDNTFVEPLLAVSWVRTTFEEISLTPGEIQPGDAQSLRAAVGLRFGGTLPGQTVSATYFVTGRGWNEFEGESATLMHNLGADLGFTDEFSGLFGQTEAGINVFNASNTLSGFLTGGVKFKDGYSAVDFSLGLRMAW